ncbi:protein C1orf43 homolog isoform X1 [Hemiscyllium ocellatum]|uniref:protein C1orf43 homolog isoform X1 n=1 Tax=Hemiscyllium ocellatum TaxID=170820 RepID=UPI002966B20A|nr:protein C1orf43 homolog isoform X1 [Hemiscyllium ocellatum]
MASGTSLSGVNVVLVMAYGSLVFVLLFIFVKRQIMRFAMKSRRGPHAPIGHSAPKDLREEIDRSLLKVQDLDYEPQLLDEGDARLLQLQETGNQGPYNYLYRMKALDAIRHVDLPTGEGTDFVKYLTGKSFRNFLMELREGNTPFRGVRKNLIDKLIDGYESARHGTAFFGKVEYLKYQHAVNELTTILQSRNSRGPAHHQAAAKELTHSPESTSPSTIQVTYLPSNQKSKRPKHFLELKSFKDNYNTLESTL